MTRPLKIAVVTETFHPKVNSVAMNIGIMTRELCARGHHLEVIRPQQHEDRYPSTRPLYAEVLVKGLPIPGYPAMRIGLPATRLLKQRWAATRPDVVQLVTEGPLGLSAMFAARKLGIPVVSEYHTNFNAYGRHCTRSWMKQPIASYLKYLHNATTVTLAPTTELVESLRCRGYNRVKFVARGVDTNHFSPDHRSTLLRRFWGASSDDLIVLYVGRLAAGESMDLLFDAFDAIEAVNRRARLVLVGDGPKCPSLVRKYHRHFYAGTQRGQSLATHYASADMFLYPSTTEAFGNVTLEAMASGLAVVAFDYAAARDHIRHNVNGLLSHFGDHCAFKTLAAELASDPRRYERLGRAARSAALNASLSHVIDDLEAIMFEAAGQTPMPKKRPTYFPQKAAP